MKLEFNTHLIGNYKSKSQIARVLTENWVEDNGYCPSCGCKPLLSFANNQPVADFFCQVCKEEYELKSKKGKLSTTINDGAYSTMLERISAENNPNFFFLTYTATYQVQNFLVLPKHFVTPDIIIKRKPLAPTARRAGWVGCTIDLSKVSSKGKVFLIRDGQCREPEHVARDFNQTLFLRDKTPETKGWLLTTLNCLDKIPEKEFHLEALYAFEPVLRSRYPNNHHIKDKLRQQLQILRDKGFIEFLGRGWYRKL
ncbi:DpnI domain-containing protein [Streptococcus oriscaviae]|uniref:Restriction endonuclease n=1 Tax=Streptococcus oriscaviae TaxID=2781599 RepID=A0ABX7YIF5_9STRE|nr:DpnI domain-containing protein [Streptococcus oriscaviae]QUE53587.1 restriction endonuclease [Streptococcus oriscaviae]